MKKEQIRKRVAGYPPKMATIEKRSGEVVTLHFPIYEGMDWLVQAFSTRYGGVSEGIYASMNFKVDADDTPENVYENYKRIGKVLGCDPEKMVRPGLVHGTRVHLVRAEDEGEGIHGITGLKGYDALITDRRGITLVTTYADCVPLYFVDERHYAIGLAHSGWRGTAAKIGLETVKAMKAAFDSEPEDIYAVVGPCICGECYEVGREVYGQFCENFDVEADEKTGIRQDDIIYPSEKEGKFYLNLRKANERVFREAGILPDHIEVSDLCTCCNPDFLFSHRATQGKRGAMAAFLGIR